MFHLLAYVQVSCEFQCWIGKYAEPFREIVQVDITSYFLYFSSILFSFISQRIAYFPPVVVYPQRDGGEWVGL